MYDVDDSKAGIFSSATYLFFFAEKVPGVGLSSNVTVRLFLVRGAPLAKSHSWALPVK